MIPILYKIIGFTSDGLVFKPYILETVYNAIVPILIHFTTSQSNVHKKTSYSDPLNAMTVCTPCHNENT